MYVDPERITINDVWESINRKEIIYWNHPGYIVRKKESIKNNSYQKNHFSYRNGYILTIDHVQGYSSIIQPEELNKLQTISESEYRNYLDEFKETSYINSQIYKFKIAQLEVILLGE